MSFCSLSRGGAGCAEDAWGAVSRPLVKRIAARDQQGASSVVAACSFFAVVFRDNGGDGSEPTPVIVVGQGLTVCWQGDRLGGSFPLVACSANRGLRHGGLWSSVRAASFECTLHREIQRFVDRRLVAEKRAESSHQTAHAAAPGTANKKNLEYVDHQVRRHLKDLAHVLDVERGFAGQGGSAQMRPEVFFHEHFGESAEQRLDSTNR